MHESFRSRFARRVGTPLAGLFRQGRSPQKIALCLALGTCLSLFPILGTTTVLCTAAAVAFRMNLPAIQAINWLMSGPHLLMIPVFLRIGERISGAPPIPFDAAEWARVFAETPGVFVLRFGHAALHAILGWTVTAVPAAAVGYAILVPILRHRIGTLFR